jgi:signal transduction histidine kinase
MTDRTRAQPPAERQNPAPAAPAGGSHVVVVDDQPVVREFLSEVLRGAGYRVTCAATGPEAIELSRHDAPHVLLTDLQMADMDGDELIRRLRGEHPAVVPVVITGYGTVQRTVDLMRGGAFDVLTKPCPAAEITATVAKAVEHHEALRLNGELRERLRVQEKLAMIGKLAAGVAHELNNPLDAALRCVRMAKDRTGADPEASEMLDLAHSGLLRMADIVKSLLTFSRQAAVEQTPQPLAALVDEAVAGVALALGDEAPAVAVVLDPEVGSNRVPRGLHQVLTNLLRNAADATGRTGHVTVEGLRDGERLRLRVKDDGPGMPVGVLQRIFEPFFTTKPPGKGTGLGLPISARIVEKFGGSIGVECPPAGGTVATVTLPLAGVAAPAAA